ncbi:MAG: DUF2848 family protein [Solirubrobacteraceae bacterium]
MSLFHDATTGAVVPFSPAEVVLAGYTGRDQAAVQRHIDELAAHGVPVPARVPAYYSITPGLVVAAGAIDVLGPETSGEVEYLLLHSDGELYVGLGSDHTDRGLERTSVTYAKQLCPKVVCPRLWRYADVAEHWDRLVLRSFAGAERRLYQEGPVTAMLDPDDILARVWRRTGRGLDGVLVFSGTLALAGELDYADRFAAELGDETTGAKLTLDYTVNVVEPLD